VKTNGNNQNTHGVRTQAPQTRPPARARTCQLGGTLAAGSLVSFFSSSSFASSGLNMEGDNAGPADSLSASLSPPPLASASAVVEREPGFNSAANLCFRWHPRRCFPGTYPTEDYRCRGREKGCQCTAQAADRKRRTDGGNEKSRGGTSKHARVCKWMQRAKPLLCTQHLTFRMPNASSTPHNAVARFLGCAIEHDTFDTCTSFTTPHVRRCQSSLLPSLPSTAHTLHTYLHLTDIHG